MLPQWLELLVVDVPKSVKETGIHFRLMFGETGPLVRPSITLSGLRLDSPSSECVSAPPSRREGRPQAGEGHTARNASVGSRPSLTPVE